jgi:ribonuclease VapC
MLGSDRLDHLDLFLSTAAIETVSFDLEQVLTARNAFPRSGKGGHLAGLILGDCYSCALAWLRDKPLLFKGSDFCHKDIRRAL